VRFASRTFVGIGVLAVIGAIAWRLFAPGAVLGYPADLATRPAVTGDISLLVTPGTLVRAESPLKLGIDVDNRVRVVQQTGDEVTVQETQYTTIRNPFFPEPALTASELRYVIDVGTSRNVADDRAYAYDADEVPDRSPAYTSKFPFHTGDGPYTTWKNETGQPFSVTRDGGSTTVGGVELITLIGTQQDAALTPAYIETLAPKLAMPTELPLVDLSALFGQQPPLPLIGFALPMLEPADARRVLDAVSEPVPLTFTMDSRTADLVEPTTGVLVSQTVSQTVSARPDLTASLGTVVEILNQDRYSANSGAAGTADILQGYLDNPPPTQVVEINYTGTDASIAAVVESIRDDIDHVTFVERTVPLLIAGVGVLCLLVGLPMGAALRRRDSDLEFDDPPVTDYDESPGTNFQPRRLARTARR
jgi:DUF3068 family protein